MISVVSLTDFPLNYKDRILYCGYHEIPDKMSIFPVWWEINSFQYDVEYFLSVPDRNVSGGLPFDQDECEQDGNLSDEIQPSPDRAKLYLMDQDRAGVEHVAKIEEWNKVEK